MNAGVMLNDSHASNTVTQQNYVTEQCWNRPSESVQKILGNYAEFPGGHITRQKRSIMRQIMRFHIEHVLSLDSQQHWRFQRLCMMFPMLNSLKLALFLCLFCPAYAFFINYKISHGLWDRTQFKINCAKSHHRIISEALVGTFNCDYNIR